MTATTKPYPCSWEGSGGEADFCARRGVRREHIRHGSVSAERRSPCAKRSSQHDRANCMVTAKQTNEEPEPNTVPRARSVAVPGQSYWALRENAEWCCLTPKLIWTAGAE